MKEKEKPNLQFNKDLDDLFESVLRLKTVKECERFFLKVMNSSELEIIRDRYQIKQALNKKTKKGLKFKKEMSLFTTNIKKVVKSMKEETGQIKLFFGRLFGTHHHPKI